MVFCVYLVRVDGDGVDVIGVSIREYPPRAGLHHQLHWSEHRDTQASDGAGVSQQAVVLLQIVALGSLVPLAHLP